NLTTSLADFKIIASISLPDTEFYTHPNTPLIEFRFIKPAIKITVKRKEIIAIFIVEKIIFQSKQMDTPETPLIELEEQKIKIPIIKNGIISLKVPDILINKSLKKNFQIQLRDLF
ncbi:MAG: hypothetical protein PVI26_09940, partial [Chitinispirillia bacterium]